MKGGKTTTKEKIGIAILSICLWIETALLGLSIGFDYWVSVSSANSSKEWVLGLWRACAVPSTKGTIFYQSPSNNCTDIGDFEQLISMANSGVWNIELQLLSLVLILISMSMTIVGHTFFICGYIPHARCKTCGMGGLPAVLFTSGACQVVALVTVHLMANSTNSTSFELSYYLTAANQLPTWTTAIATLVATCRVG